MALFNPLAVALTGSGPTWFALFEDQENANRLYKELKNAKIESYLVTPKTCALEIE